jgi:hypothetical protein
MSREAGLARRKRPTAGDLKAERLEEMIRRASSIGDLERMASVGRDHVVRDAFWRDCAHLPGAASLDAGVAELKRRIRLNSAA